MGGPARDDDVKFPLAQQATRSGSGTPYPSARVVGKKHGTADDPSHGGQRATAELLVTDTLWPDFGVDDLKAAIAEYNSRIRRFGGRPEREQLAGHAGR